MRITLTYQQDRWVGRIHQCEGWIARVIVGDTFFCGWAPTRRQAYQRAYRWMHKVTR